MFENAARPYGAFDVGVAVLVAAVFVLVASRLREPARQQVMAVLVGGAGAAYLSGGFGPWELLLPTVVTYLAWRGLRGYRFIGAAWLLHTGADLLHHLYGQPIWSFAPTSSLQCAVADTLLAAWFFAGAPTVPSTLTSSSSPAPDA